MLVRRVGRGNVIEIYTPNDDLMKRVEKKKKKGGAFGKSFFSFSFLSCGRRKGKKRLELKMPLSVLSPLNMKKKKEKKPKAK